MGRKASEYIDYMARGIDPRELEDPHNEYGLLNFDSVDSEEHPEWETGEDMTAEELARIDSDAEIFDYRRNGYQ